MIQQQVKENLCIPVLSNPSLENKELSNVAFMSTAAEDTFILEDNGYYKIFFSNENKMQYLHV